MDEDTRAIEREILVEREELSGTLRELESHARQLADWRSHYRKHTGAALALSFGAGVMMGLLVPGAAPRRGAGRAHAAVSPEAWEPGWEAEERPPARRRQGNAAIRGIKNLSQSTHAGQQLSDTAAGIFNALLGVASAKAVDLIAHLVPGFHDEYHGRRGATNQRYGDSRF